MMVKSANRVRIYRAIHETEGQHCRERSGRLEGKIGEDSRGNTGGGQYTFFYSIQKVKVKSNYFIVRPKFDQKAGQLSLPHLGIFAIHTR